LSRKDALEFADETADPSGKADVPSGHVRPEDGRRELRADAADGRAARGVYSAIFLNAKIRCASIRPL
jgi:hypothetical protein